MPPFTVLHVCTGNICRSPMSERFFAHYMSDAGFGPDHVLSMSAGTSAFHHGEDMQSNSRAELEERGVDGGTFHSRPVHTSLTGTAELILGATNSHVDYVSGTDPDAFAKTFLVRQLGLIAADMDTSILPPLNGTPESVLARGLAFVAHAQVRRPDYKALQLDDPWSLGRAVYKRIADQLEEALDSIAAVLTGKR